MFGAPLENASSTQEPVCWKMMGTPYPPMDCKHVCRKDMDKSFESAYRLQMDECAPGQFGSRMST